MSSQPPMPEGDKESPQTRSYAEERFVRDVEERTLSDLRNWVGSIHARITDETETLEKRIKRSTALVWALFGIGAAVFIFISTKQINDLHSEVMAHRETVLTASNQLSSIQQQVPEARKFLEQLLSGSKIWETNQTAAVMALNKRVEEMTAMFSNTVRTLQSDLHTLSNSASGLQGELMAQRQTVSQLKETIRQLEESATKVSTVQKSSTDLKQIQDELVRLLRGAARALQEKDSTALEKSAQHFEGLKILPENK